MDFFKNNIAIVTGCASGIGQMLCEELAAPGAVVNVADPNFDGAQRVASKIVGNGGRANAASLDVSNADAVRELVNRVATENHRLDFIFNNAGIGVGDGCEDRSEENPSMRRAQSRHHCFSFLCSFSLVARADSSRSSFSAIEEDG